MKRWFFLAALCLLTLSVSYADNGLPHQWNYGDAVYGHEVQWNFDEVMDQIGSGSSISSLTSDVNTLKAQMATAQADIANSQVQIATNQADITTLQGQVATAQNDIVNLQAVIPYSASMESVTASTTRPLQWSTGSNYYQVPAAHFVKYTIDVAAAGGVPNGYWFGTFHGGAINDSFSGQVLIGTWSYTCYQNAAAVDWKFYPSINASGQLQIIASTPADVSASATIQITKVDW